MIIQGVALDVMGDLYTTEHPREEKLAHFIQAYFFEGRTIVDITSNVLGLFGRSSVSSTYRVEVEVFELGAQRFLTLVELSNPLVASSGLQEALERQVRRWDRAAQRVTDALQQLHAHRYGASGAHTAHMLPSSRDDAYGGSMPTSEGTGPTSERQRR